MGGSTRKESSKSELSLSFDAAIAFSSLVRSASRPIMSPLSYLALLCVGENDTKGEFTQIFLMY